MTKSEIIATTLDELLERFRKNPECFEYLGEENEVRYKSKLPMNNIVWQTKVESGDKLVDDPTSQPRTIIVTYSSLEKAIQVRIYNKTYASIGDIDGASADAFIEYRKYFMKWRRNYKKFAKLRDLILTHYQHREARAFLSKLSAVFPNILDHHIFGR